MIGTATDITRAAALTISDVASVARAQANLTQASAQVRRYKPLLAANAVSRQDYDTAVEIGRDGRRFEAARALAVRMVARHLARMHAGRRGFARRRICILRPAYRREI